MDLVSATVAELKGEAQRLAGEVSALMTQKNAVHAEIDRRTNLARARLRAQGLSEQERDALLQVLKDGT